ncbi:diguanylate cyclase [Caldimonas thermodepolymerans]|nr:sensor domain-containing diguanylate cyclase [Caldimonas thermodepolymerans]QPC32868.1 diguanylate cyclase [Caldimonas thermodepolymerans]RDI03644.1 diguanylate cyclase (GGDEF)-like protein [Caldimonas thermodepolymerans]
MDAPTVAGLFPSMSAASPPASPPLSPDRLLELIGSARQGVGIFDETDTLVYANCFYRELLHVPEDGRPTWKDILRANHREQSGTRIETQDFDDWLASAASRRGKLPFRAFEADLHDGRWVHVTETTLPNGWMLCVLTDITELGADERTLRQQRDLALRAALSDPLTGLSNRRHMHETLATLHASQQLHPAAIVLLDIDHFKRVNDTLGHDQGDLLLKQFARLLQGEVRQKDLACRWGGEEFLLLLRDTTPAAAEPILDRIFQAVRASAPLPQQPQFRYTCSAGLAFIWPEETVHAALKRADEALYAAKGGGRNRWVTC